MALTRLPLLIDAHFHARDFNQQYKGTFESETMAALAGGVGTVLAMPNTDPPLLTRSAIVKARKYATGKTYCDLGFYLGTDGRNFAEFSWARDVIKGLKIYLDPTSGNLELKDRRVAKQIFALWPLSGPILVHAEGVEKLELALDWAKKYNRRVHICHVSTADQVQAIAKERYYRKGEITSEVCPHHLAFTESDLSRLGPLGVMKPPLGTEKDREALWEGLTMGSISIVATDHAPHSLEEKASETPPFGVTAEPLFPVLYTLFRQRRLSWGLIIQKMYDVPAEIFDLRPDLNSFMEVDLDSKFFLEPSMIHSQAQCSPYLGMELQGRVVNAFLHGEQVIRNGETIAKKGQVI